MFPISKTYHIKTFGCQMNTSDSERLATFLEAQGFLPSEKIQEANLVIFNTCGVKQTAENRAYSMINNLRKKKLLATGSQSTAIVMTGCLANRADVQKRMKNKVDLFCEIKNFQEDFKKLNLCHPELASGSPNSKVSPLKIGIPDRVRNDRKIKKNSIKNLYNKEDLDYLSIQPKHQNSFEAYVPIMTGCNNFCAYCVVPNARGREVSRPAEEILSEVKNLISKGYKNIILLGQNVNSYKSPTSLSSSPSGRRCPVLRTDEGKGCDFATLLEKINAIDGKFWIQFVSSHPKDMSDDLIQTIAKCQKVCETVHLPLQAGDDEILRRMNRNYTQAHYLTLIDKIKKAFAKHKPDQLFSISSDIIVGFPGETKKQFLQSAQVMKKAKFDMVFFGQFSPRPQTVAWTMKDNVPQTEKARREKFLNEILKETALENNQKYLGQTLEVLIEKQETNLEAKPPLGDLASKLAPKLIYFGKTRTLKNVKIISTKKDLIGKIVKVKITKANVWNLEGEA
ncbi:MAG: MiaB/RimO family radical SAM methylthiotransferase [Candidatus Moraniibacteriota bacterium]